MNSRDSDTLAVVIGLFLASAALSIVAVLVLGGMASYFWNCFAPDLFDMPRATYRNGVGAVGLWFCLKAICPTFSFDGK